MSGDHPLVDISNWVIFAAMVSALTLLVSAAGVSIALWLGLTGRQAPQRGGGLIRGHGQRVDAAVRCLVLILCG